MTALSGKVTSVQIGEVPTGKSPKGSPPGAAVEVCRQAINDAGTTKNEIDVVPPTDHFASRRFNTGLASSVLVEELGLGGRAKSNMRVFAICV